MWIPWISYNVTDVPSKADWFSLVLFYCYWLLVLLSTTKGIFLFLKQKLKLLMLLLKERSSIESFKGMASFILALSPQILTTVSVEDPSMDFDLAWTFLHIPWTCTLFLLVSTKQLDLLSEIMGTPLYTLMPLVLTSLLCQALPSVSAAVFSLLTGHDNLWTFFVVNSKFWYFFYLLKICKKIKTLQP